MTNAPAVEHVVVDVLLLAMAPMYPHARRCSRTLTRGCKVRVHFLLKLRPSAVFHKGLLLALRRCRGAGQHLHIRSHVRAAACVARDV